MFRIRKIEVQKEIAKTVQKGPILPCSAIDGGVGGGLLGFRSVLVVPTSMGLFTQAGKRHTQKSNNKSTCFRNNRIETTRESITVMILIRNNLYSVSGNSQNSWQVVFPYCCVFHLI